MPELTITLDPKDIARFRRMIRAHPMMAAKALTFTAERAVPAWRAGQAVFHRRNSWIDRGVRVTFATLRTSMRKWAPWTSSWPGT